MKSSIFYISVTLISAHCLNGSQLLSVKPLQKAMTKKVKELEALNQKASKSNAVKKIDAEITGYLTAIAGLSAGSQPVIDALIKESKKQKQTPASIKALNQKIADIEKTTAPQKKELQTKLNKAQAQRRALIIKENPNIQKLETEISGINKKISAQLTKLKPADKSAA